MTKNVKKVLLVEDENDLRSIIASELVELGYEVHEAKDGEEGFAMAEKIRPDIILSDVVMPKKSGSDLLKELRKTEFGKNIPFIVLTARVNMKDYFEVLKVSAFLEKPFKINGLAKAIDFALGPLKADVAQRDARPFSGTVAFTKSIKEDGIIVSSAEAVVDANMTHSLEGTVVTFDKTMKVQKALLVEDDEKVARKIENIFFENGYLTRRTVTSSRCIEEGVNYSPDVIFLKGVISGMKASSLVDLLRGMLSFRYTPIVVYGGNELSEQKKDLLKQDNVHVLSAEAGQILDLVRQFLTSGIKHG